jgi:hypothetical protein
LFPYGRSFFYLRSVLLLVLFVAFLLFLGTQTLTPAPWLAAFAALLTAYLVIVGLSPLLTKHALLRSRAILRQGWYFRAIVPFEDAEEIGPWDGEPKYGIRLSLARRILFVVGSAQNLVSIRLRVPRRLPHVLFLKTREIVFDVDDRDAFLAAVEERRAAGVPLPAHKVLVLPPARR